MSQISEETHLVDDSRTGDAGKCQAKSFFFGGIYTLVKYMNKHRNDEVTYDDIDGHFNYGVTEDNFKTVKELWTNEKENNGERGGSFFNVWSKFTCRRMSLQVLTVLCDVLVSAITSGYIPYSVISYLEEPNSFSHIPWLLAAGYIFFLVGKTFLFPLYTQLGLEIGHRLRCGMIALCYDKLLKLQCIDSSTLSNLITIVNQGSQRVINQCQYSFCIPGSIITVIVCTAYLYTIVGISSFVGMGIFTFFILLKGLSGCLNVYLRRKMFIYTEMRIRKLHEIFQGIRMIKMYGLEDTFIQVIDDIRKKETFYNYLAHLSRNIASNLFNVSPQIACIATLYGYYSANSSLDAAESFAVLMVFNIARFNVILIGLTSQNFGEMIVMCHRVNEFLGLPEFHNNSSTHMCKNVKNVIETTKAEFSWNTQNDTQVDCSSVEYKQLRLCDINLTIQRKSLIGICGSVASGKSSLLSALMNRMHLISGSSAVTGSIGYVPQQAWVFNATFRENILFGQKFDQIRYDNVLNACMLMQDIQRFPRKDLSEIGERGLNLSGGQKQRLSLARAVYKDSDLYFLDDPLSAMDVHVGKQVFLNCIRRLLIYKTVLLVTHQMQYLEFCDKIIVMSAGSISERGTHKELLERNGIYYKLYEKYIKSKPEDDNATSKNENKYKSFTNKLECIYTRNGLLTGKESVVLGSISLKMIRKYVQACGGYFIVLLTFSMLVLNACYQIFVPWWMYSWIDDLKHVSANHSEMDLFLNMTDQNNVLLDRNLKRYPIIFLFSIAILLGLTAIQIIFTTTTLMRGSTNIHKEALQHILRSPMVFFDTNPTGRIMNRFSSDMDNIDIFIPRYVDALLNLFFGTFLALLFVVILIPWILLVCIPVGIILLLSNKWIAQSLIKTQRLQSTSFSPLLSHLGTTVSGLSNITAFGQSKNMWKKAMRLTDINGSLMYMCSKIKKWQGLIFDIYLSTISIGTMIGIIFTKGWIDSALAGLILTMCIKAGSSVTSIVFLYSEICPKLISVERLGEYCHLEEADKESDITDQKFNNNWPMKGRVQFSNVSMQYRPDTPNALYNISFCALPGENIGIVGRTGAGKSSIVAALFRLYDLSNGQIYIDGVDVSTIDKTVLRNNIVNVQQDPMLFSGSIRFNLDPSGTCSDEQLWEVLSQVYMKLKILQSPQKLDYVIQEGGSNLSVGERQLLCLGRAILCQPCVLVLDEATASIDTETDFMIQQTIREHFSTCTVITIAHRLNTILHCNRVIVVNHGSLLEFGTPTELLSDVNSEFYSMYHAQPFVNST